MKSMSYDQNNRPVISSGHLGFDRQTNMISPGQVISNTQLSRWIRPESLEYDLQWFNNPDNNRCSVLKMVVREQVRTSGKPIILYQFHWYPRHKNFLYSASPKRIFGWILTETNGEFIKICTYDNRMQTYHLIQSVLDYVADLPPRLSYLSEL